MNLTNDKSFSSVFPSTDFFMYNYLYNRNAMESVGVYIFDDSCVEEYSESVLGITLIPPPAEQHLVLPSKEIGVTNEDSGCSSPETNYEEYFDELQQYSTSSLQFTYQHQLAFEPGSVPTQADIQFTHQDRQQTVDSEPGPVLNFSDKQTKLPCDECGAEFQHKLALQRHKFRAHSGKECKSANCDKKYCDEELFNIHIESRICADRKFMCDICGIENDNKRNLTRHLHNHGASNEPFSGFCVIEV